MWIIKQAWYMSSCWWTEYCPICYLWRKMPARACLFSLMGFFSSLLLHSKPYRTNDMALMLSIKFHMYPHEMMLGDWFPQLRKRPSHTDVWSWGGQLLLHIKSNENIVNGYCHISTLLSLLLPLPGHHFRLNQHVSNHLTKIVSYIFSSPFMNYLPSPCLNSSVGSTAPS